MTRELDWFWDGFEEIADAPNGVARLRELILSLAVQGRLVRQDPNDEPASALLGRIAEEKARLMKAGQIRKSAPLPPVGEEEAPFELPESWAWVRIGEVGQVVGGGTPQSENSSYFSSDGIPWLTPADLYGLKEKYVSKGKRGISEAGLKNSSAQLMPTGTIIFSSRAPIGYVAIAANPLATNQGFKSCVPFVDGLSDYLYYFLKHAGKAIDESATGTTFKEISGKQFGIVILPLPPLTEQGRIVAKVDELMALCDELETRQKEKRAGRVVALGATLHRLGQAQGADEFETRLETLADHFEELLDAPECVAPLRTAILGLAVQGQLEAQNEGDEPASALLESV